MRTEPKLASPPSDGLVRFSALACGLTWLLAAPLTLAWIRHAPPPPYAVACAGLSAFGPLVAALSVAGRQRRLGEVFGRWRTNPLWILVALFVPMGIHLTATTLFVVIGGEPAHWFYPPSTPEQIAALVVFPIGEEFGWRGFAHPRLVGRYGLVKGSLALGAVWGLWHLAYSIPPDTGRFDTFAFVTLMVQLPLYALIFAWFFERANRSMAVAIALHAGGHLDHLEGAPRTDLRLHALNLVVLAIFAAIAARSLALKRNAPSMSISPPVV